MKKNRRVDLHVHTTASDGTWTCEEVLENLKRKHIEVFSITDHDCIDNVIEMKELADQASLKFITGVELSVTYMGREHHITTYNFEIDNPIIQRLAKENINIRETHNLEFLKYCTNRFETIDLASFHSYKNDPSRGGWNTLNYLIDAGVIEDTRGFFKLFNEYGQKLLFNDPKEIIDKIKQAGAIPVLAHPSAYNDGALLPTQDLAYWKDIGILGIECYSPYLKDLQHADYYKEFCNKNNLYITGGSDCHGGFVKRELGTPEVYEDMINFI